MILLLTMPDAAFGHQTPATSGEQKKIAQPQKLILLPKNLFLMTRFNFGFKTKNLGEKVNHFLDFIILKVAGSM
jgi:hypothetical protein